MGKSGANTFFYIRHPFDTQLTIPALLPEFTKRGIDLDSRRGADAASRAQRRRRVRAARALLRPCDERSGLCDQPPLRRGTGALRGMVRRAGAALRILRRRDPLLRLPGAPDPGDCRRPRVL